MPTPQVPTIVLNMAKPAGSAAKPDIDPEAVALARPSLIFAGDETTWQHAVSGGVDLATGWGSRVGPNAYAQANAAKQGVWVDGTVTFNGTTDATGTRYTPSWAAPAVLSDMTVLHAVEIAQFVNTRYLWGVASSSTTDDRCLFVSAAGLTLQMGGAVATIPAASIPLNQLLTIVASVGTRDNNGVTEAYAELHCNGVRKIAYSTDLPVTARSMTLGVSAGGQDSTVFPGKVRRRWIYAEMLDGNRAFFRDMVGEAWRRALGLANPVIEVA